MGHKAKMKKKNKVAPCPDANSRVRERIANQRHKSEVIQRKIEELMKKRKEQMEKEANGAKKPED